MALTRLAFRPRDFSGNMMGSISEVYFQPVQMSARASGNWILIDRPTRADTSGVETGPFTVDLEANQVYTLEVIWHDQDRVRVGRSQWPTPFRVPESGEDEQINLNEVIGLPPRNGLIRVIQIDPTGSMWDQYVYNEQSGDLFERFIP